MTQQKNAQRPLIVGKPALIMVDFQRGGPYVPGTENGISHMDFAEERRRTARTLVAAARGAQIPVIFIQEVHRPDHVDFGRELDGDTLESRFLLRGNATAEMRWRSPV